MQITVRTCLPQLFVTILLSLCVTNTLAQQVQPWAYKAGVQGEARQANFCQDTKAALEIAEIFARFGAPTGYSALSNSPSCSTTVYAVTPIDLLRQVKITLENGDNYFVNFIQVEANDKSTPVLVTTRHFIQE